MVKRIAQYWSGIWSRFTPAPEETAPPARPRSYPKTRIITTIGTVVFDKKSGFYSIRTESGTRYLPFNLRDYPKCLENGLRVHFTAVLYPGVATLGQLGTTVKLLNLNRAPI